MPLKGAIVAVTNAGRCGLASSRPSDGDCKAEDQRAKAFFLAGMGHEFRTPLTAIMGFSDILLKQGPGMLEPARQREYVECIHASSAHLLELVNDWLDLSKLETGRMEMCPSQVDLGVLFHQTLLLTRAQAHQAGLTLTTQISPGLPDLWVDRRMLMQILLNHLSNAIKFTPAGGSVSLEAWCLSGGGLRIAVCDSGIGLEESDVALLADPFVQIDNQVNRRTRGSGLGLYLARSMIELHGAKLAISSRPGDGFCASFVVPQSRIVPSVAVVAS
jgi:signal transduction histidine kinase